MISPIAVNDNQIDPEITAGSRAGDLLSYRLSPPYRCLEFIGSGDEDRAEGQSKSARGDVDTADWRYAASIRSDPIRSGPAWSRS